MPNFYVDRGFSTNNNKIEPNESATVNSADQENESEIKENPEEKVGIFFSSEINSIKLNVSTRKRRGGMMWNYNKYFMPKLNIQT